MRPRETLVRTRLPIALVVTLLCAGVTAVAVASTGDGRRIERSSYEVWTIDQSDTRADGGGNLYVYDGGELAADPSGARSTSEERHVSSASSRRAAPPGDRT